HDAAVRDSEQSVAVARALGPAALSGALLFAAQAHLYAGELDRAAEQLAEAERVGAPVDASKLGSVPTVYGDLAMASGSPQESLNSRLAEGLPPRAAAWPGRANLLGYASLVEGSLVLSGCARAGVIRGAAWVRDADLS